MKTYLVTGAAGFIGSNFVKYMLKKYENIELVIIDKLTYAGNLGTLKEELKDKRVKFYKGDIKNTELVENIFMNHDINYVVNFAAESHVDRSIENPQLFLETNILGTQNLLDIAKKFWSVGKDDAGYPIYKDSVKFLQVSTDEVYGSLEKKYLEPKLLKIDDEKVRSVVKDRDKIYIYGDSFFMETTPIDPRSPYSSSKASADLIVNAYMETYKFPANITRCSNNYGPYQFPEKLIPLMIKNVLEGKSLPVYGKGENVRDWLYVEDHIKAIDLVLEKGNVGEVYNIGGFNEEMNINIIKEEISDGEAIKEKYKNIVKTNLENINENLITFVKDRLGHDMRYAIDPSKIARELGWYPETTFNEGIRKTIKWYLDNQGWVNEVASGEYQKYYEKMYAER